MSQSRSQQFATTRWSIVCAAGQSSTQTARAAMEELCALYWPPIYAYIRRRGYSKSDAEDLTQAFFLHVLESSFVQTAKQQRGRFRSFLLKSVSNFLNVAYRTASTQKRGGHLQAFSLDFEFGEANYCSQVSESLSAERIFERNWALTVLKNSVEKLREDYEQRGLQRVFEMLEAHVNTDANRLPYAELCRNLDMTEDAIKQAARRLKLRYREILRSEVAGTVSHADEVDDELRRLLQAL